MMAVGVRLRFTGWWPTSAPEPPTMPLHPSMRVVFNAPLGVGAQRLIRPWSSGMILRPAASRNSLSPRSSTP